MLTPPFTHRFTSDAVVRQSNDEEEIPLVNLPVADRHAEEGAVHTPGSGPSVHDIIALILISFMLIWPLLFFIAVWVQKGIQMNNQISKLVENNPRDTTYFITFICNIISMIVGALLSLATIRFAQELISNSETTKPFTATVLLAVRHQNWPWGYWVGDARYLLAKERRWPAALVVLCVCTFPQVLSSTTSLLTPAPFNRTATLTGTELDFSSTASECLEFFAASPLNNICDYFSHNNLSYTNCLGENQMVDVLEAGRGNILELVSNNNQSLTFSQLGADDGLHFLGSIRGVLPIGPDGAPAFNTLEASPLSDQEIRAGMMSYDYTLNLQGLSSNVSCRYTQTNPFKFTLLDNNGFYVAYNASCATLGGIEALTDVSYIPSINSTKFLAVWACQSALGGAPMASYTIYLAGLDQYAPKVGNIACTVNPMQAAIYSVTYRSTSRIFTAANTTSSASAIAFTMFINHALTGLADVISEGQNNQSNLVAESVFTFGAKSFKLLPTQSDKYLQLFEQMIQGILEYEISYLRLIYSTLPDAPPACIRTVNGTVTYTLFGWFVTAANIWFLVPITIINLGALFALAQAMLLAKASGYKFPPSEDRKVVYGGDPDEQDSVPDEWKEKISFHPVTVWKEALPI